MINNAEFIVKSLNTLSKKYRSIAVKLETQWGTETNHDYLADLLSRNDSQRGFDQDIYSLLMLMYSVHRDQYTDFNKPLTLGHMNINLHSLEIDPTNRMTPDQAIQQLKDMLPHIETADEQARRLASKLIKQD